MATREIPLTQGKIALVDEEDFEWLNSSRWCAAKSHRNKFVAMRRGTLGSRNRETILMAREILGLRKGDKEEADHENHDTLDNRRNNLRILLPEANKRWVPSRGGSSKFVGVTWDSSRTLWRAQIQVDQVVYNLGRYSTEIEAALARDRYVIENQTGHELNLRVGGSQ